MVTHVVDTNVLSELPKRRPNPGALAWLEAQSSITMSAITLEELTFGVEHAPSEQRERLQQWLAGLMKARPVVLPVDEAVARLAGTLRAVRGRSGLSVAQADMLIAATAVTASAVLVTGNVRAFQDCGVALLNPFSP